MATKKEFKDFLKRNNLTYDQLMDVYRDVALTNSLVNNLLNISNVKIEDLRLDLLEQILTQKEKDLQRIEEEKIEQERIERLEKERLEEQAILKSLSKETIILNKIDSGYKFDEDELCSLVNTYSIFTEFGENLRFTRYASDVIDLNGRTFMIVSQRGLTDNLPDEYTEQPYEVVKYEYEKTIKVVEWRPKEDV